MKQFKVYWKDYEKEKANYTKYHKTCDEINRRLKNFNKYKIKDFDKYFNSVCKSMNITMTDEEFAMWKDYFLNNKPTHFADSIEVVLDDDSACLSDYMAYGMENSYFLINEYYTDKLVRFRYWG